MIDEECLVRPECRKHAKSEILRVHQEVVLKRSSRIIAGTDHLHAEPLEDIPRRQIVRLKPLVRALPNRLCGLLVEQFVDVEVALKFQVSPMVEWVAQSVRNRARPIKEFFLGRSWSSTEILRNAVCPHGTPFVMITLQPDLGEIAEAAITSDISCGKMGVIIDDGLRLRVLVVEPLGRRGMEQEIVVNEVHKIPIIGAT